jgi:hypothetical protein
MQTNRSESRSISIEAPPETVVGFLADARALPRWAPNFAKAVTPDGDHWRVDNGEAEFTVELRVSREAGTVDILRPGDRRRGFFMRVVGNGDGSECVFTQVFPAGTPEEAVARQLAVVESELRAVRESVQAVW